MRVRRVSMMSKTRRGEYAQGAQFNRLNLKQLFLDSGSLLFIYLFIYLFICKSLPYYVYRCTAIVPTKIAIHLTKC